MTLSADKQLQCAAMELRNSAREHSQVGPANDNGDHCTLNVDEDLDIGGTLIGSQPEIGEDMFADQEESDAEGYCVIQ